MTEQMVRKNGYYIVDGKYVPSVTTVCKGGGSAASGLMKWAAEQGGVRVLTELTKVKDYGRLEETLGNTDSIEWAKTQARIGFEQGGGWARRFGTEVHRLLEDYYKGTEDAVALEHLPSEIVTAYKTFRTVLNDLALSESLSEGVITHSESDIRYAGRYDLVANLADTKTKILTPYLTRNSSTPVAGTYIIDFKTGELYDKEHKAQLSAYATAYEKNHNTKIAGGLIFNVSKKDVATFKAVCYSREELREAYDTGFKPAYTAWLYWEAPLWYKEQYTAKKKK